jgi:tetratricopeptide (TPR) repeat protein
VTNRVYRLRTAAIRRAFSKCVHAGVIFAGLFLLHAVPMRAQQTTDWMMSLRKEVDAHHLAAALEIADQRLAIAPDDTDARGWRARTLAWLGNFQEAELEFRGVLSVTPNDPDVLSGLANVLVREQQQEEGLLLLNQAIAIDSDRADILDQRGSLLIALGRRSEARSDFLAALSKNTNDQTARAALDSLAPQPRHELHFGSDTDAFNYTHAANAETLEMTSHWDPRWTTSFAGIFYQRFGANAAKFSGSISRRFRRTDSLTIGGAVARDQGVIPRGEAFVQYGHGFRLSETYFFRGLETDFQSHWFWYRDARVLGLTSTAIFYVPRHATFSIAVTQARSSFSTTGPDWSPSGIARIGVPLGSRFTPNVFFAVGTEDFAQADQIGRFSARTIGGGGKYRLSHNQEISIYVARQNRSQGRPQTSFGVNYGIFF